MLIIHYVMIMLMIMVFISCKIFSIKDVVGWNVF